MVAPEIIQPTPHIRPNTASRRHRQAMKGLAPGLLVAMTWSAQLAAQERDRSLERIGLALQQPDEIVRGSGFMEAALPKTLGVFTLVAPTGPGEVLRISVPIGEFVSRAFRSVAAASHRRQETAARRRVEAELRWLEELRATSQR
jgi:hypothetical protein